MRTDAPLIQHYKAVVGGIFVGDKIRVDERPKLATRGLAGVSVQRILAEDAAEKLGNASIASIDTLCAQSPATLERIGIPTSTIQRIGATLATVGLSLGMSGNEREYASQNPPEKLIERVPDFVAKTASQRPPTRASNAGHEYPAYTRFKFDDPALAAGFFRNVQRTFSLLIMQVPETGDYLSSGMDTEKPIMRLNRYKKENGSMVYPVAISPVALEVLARFAPEHPEILWQVVQENQTSAQRHMGTGRW